MAHGGARKNAGRPPGTRNRLTAEAVAHAQATGETPLEYMLRVMRDDKADTTRRDEMAKAAAPYVHPKLASTELTGPNGGPIEHRLRDAKGDLASKLAGLKSAEAG